MSAARPRVAVIWANYGPYHLARAKALAELCALAPIEMAAVQRQYGWSPSRDGSSLRCALSLAGATRIKAACGCQPLCTEL